MGMGIAERAEMDALALRVEEAERRSSIFRRALLALLQGRNPLHAKFRKELNQLLLPEPDEIAEDEEAQGEATDGLSA